MTRVSTMGIYKAVEGITIISFKKIQNFEEKNKFRFWKFWYTKKNPFLLTYRRSMRILIFFTNGFTTRISYVFKFYDNYTTFHQDVFRRNDAMIYQLVDVRKHDARNRS